MIEPGMTFGRLTVVEFVAKPKGWLCECMCGANIHVKESFLKHGKMKSCGCAKKERFLNIVRNVYRIPEPVYSVWKNMIRRCTNPKSSNYFRYGARGIKVCEEWRSDILSFYQFCVEAGWRKGLCLDRIDNDGDYCPENCRFITGAENSRNTCLARKWIIQGREYNTLEETKVLEQYSTATLSAWCRKGVNGCRMEFKYPQKDKVKKAYR
jgi:hypothetical protein